MIIITGASGKLGRNIAELLLERVSSQQVGVSVRDPEKARSLEERGVRVRQGDYRDPASLRHAFEGASQVLLISSNSSGEDAVQHHRQAIEVARASGAGRIVYTSHMGANTASRFAPTRDHAATEAILQDSGVLFTSLCNGFYADSALLFLGQALQTGQLVAPEDGPVSWTAHPDLAEAAVIALTHPEQLSGLTVPLTNRQALDLNDIARLMADISGRPVKRVTVSDEEYRSTLLAHGLPEGRADLLLGLFAASRQGEFAAVDGMLEGLLGRSPVTMRAVVSDFLASQS